MNFDLLEIGSIFACKIFPIAIGRLVLTLWTITFAVTLP